MSVCLRHVNYYISGWKLHASVFPSVHHLLCLSALQMYSAMNPEARSEPAEKTREREHTMLCSVCVSTQGVQKISSSSSRQEITRSLQKHLSHQNYCDTQHVQYILLFLDFASQWWILICQVNRNMNVTFLGNPSFYRSGNVMVRRW